MTTRTRMHPTTDVSSFPLSDGKPVAETLANMVQMYDLMYSLHRLLAAQGRTRIAIGGNQFLYIQRAQPAR